MRWWLLLGLLFVSCAEHVVASPPSSSPPVPSTTLVPWLAAAAHPTPIPDPTVPPRPTGVRECTNAELAGGVGRGQGAGGWWIRTVVIADLGPTRCLIGGPSAVAYLDAAGAIIVTADGFGTPTWGAPGWAVLEPSRGVTLFGPVAGEALAILQTWGDCGHATLGAVRLTFSGSIGTLVVPAEPQPVGGRCDSPTERLGLTGLPLRASELPPYPTPRLLPLSFSIAAPSIAFAGETLAYVVHIRNTTSSSYSWNDGCPIYVESLGGREVSPTAVPGHAKQPPDKIYAGFAKEVHPLDCAAGGPIAPGAEIVFEMRIEVPRDAYGTDTLYWNIVAGPFPTASASAPIEFLAPRRY